MSAESNTDGNVGLLDRPPEPDWTPERVEASTLPGGGRLALDSLSVPNEKAFAELVDGLEGDSEDRIWLRRQFAVPEILDGLSGVEARSGIPAAELVENSLRFRQLSRHRVFDGEDVTIAQGSDNLMQDGTLRREEQGARLDLEAIRDAGVDPSRVLFYRVTQPSPGRPKAEYFWTADLGEARRGLTYELGAKVDTAIVLVSTLETIAQNGGLMEDEHQDDNDNGMSVRQIGLGPFDQSNALFAFNRKR